MGSYTLDLRAIGQFFTNQPTLEIWNDGFLETSSLISRSGEDISLNLSYNGNLPSSLEFRFNDGLGETGRLISLKSIKINDRHVNIGNFLSLEILDQYTTASVDISAASALFDTSEPDASSFQPSDGNFTTGNDSYRNLNNINHIIDAQDGRDTVYLGGGVDRVFGNDGNDIIYAGGADDLVSGGNGDDRLYGQDGNDIIYGGVGADRLYGQEGNDHLFGGADNDVIIGHNGDDLLMGEAGNDKLNGGNGNDILYGDAGADRLLGGNDNDTLDGGAGDDLLYGGAGDDILNGGFGNDIIFGNAGDDILNSNEGNNTLDGFVGNDILQGGAGINILNGGDDNDIIYSGSSTLIDSAVATILSNNTGVFYNSETNSFYQVVTTASTWENANTLAQSLNLFGLTGVDGHLVTITSQAENNFIDSLITSNSWIGASDTSVEGEWIWNGGPDDGVQFWQGNSFGSAVNGLYENWDTFEPTNISGTRDHASIGTNGEWDAQLAITTLGYVVEWEASSLINDAAYVSTLNGGSGLDNLYGSDEGVDLFILENSDSVDNIFNFNILNFDMIDVSSLISYDRLSDDVNDFIQLTESAGNTLISVDADGSATGSNFINIAELDSVTGLDIDVMIAAENLIV